MFWHPLSAVVSPDLGSLASPAMVRMMLRATGALELTYCGDRMSPALQHGAAVRIRTLNGDPSLGSVVLVSLDGALDLLRVVQRAPDGHWIVQGDADPAGSGRVPDEDLLGVAQVPELQPSGRSRGLHRLRLDVRESLGLGRTVEAESTTSDPATSVRDKYDEQAAFYAAAPGDEVHAPLLERIRAAVPAGARILVAGSGSGRECFGLARAGWFVEGVDFSAAMVEQARSTAAKSDLDIDFTTEDLLEMRRPRGVYAGILFTYDLYSFLPEARGRVDLLRRMRRWLADEGRIFLSARRVSSPYGRLILTLQWLHAPAGEWGASHTRYVDRRGGLRRSFVHYFTREGLQREVERAGLRAGPWAQGHTELTRPG